MIEIELNNVKKNYGLKNILDGINFEVKTGERIALVGENGSGKSTVLKIISGEENQDFGKVNIRKESNIGFLKQVYSNEKDSLNVEEYLKRSFEKYFNIEIKLKKLEKIMTNPDQDIENAIKKYGRLQEEYIASGGYELEEKFKKICSGFKFSESFLNKPYNSLSGGEKTIVKRCADDEFNKRLGFLTAFFQHYSGMSKNKANKFLAELEVEDEEKEEAKETNSENKFRVGDKVKFSKNIKDIYEIDESDIDKMKNKIFEITEISEPRIGKNFYSYYTSIGYFVREDMIEKGDK